MNDALSPAQFFPIDIPTNLYHMECEITAHRNQLLIADQYANFAGKKNLAVMPPLVQAWLEYRIAQLIAMQITLLNGQSPPTIAA